MINFKRFTVATLTLALVFMVSACGFKKPPQEKQFQEVIKEMKIKSLDTLSASFETKPQIEVLSQNGTFKLDIDAKGKIDKKDMNNKKFGLDFKVNTNMDSPMMKGEMSFDISSIVLKDKMFLQVNDYKVPDQFRFFIMQVEPLLNKYKNKWMELSIDNIPPLVKMALDQENDTKIFDIYKKKIVDSSIFTLEKDNGIKELGGRYVYDYEVKINTDGIVDLQAKISKDMGELVSEEQIKKAKEELSKIDVKIHLNIGADDYNVYYLEMKINFKDPKTGADYKIRLPVTMDNLNGNIEITEPKDFITFEEVTKTLQESMNMLLPPGIELEEIKTDGSGNRDMKNIDINVEDIENDIKNLENEIE